jgi:hypothetical protein
MRSCQRSSIFASAPLVTSTLWKRTSDTGSASLHFQHQDLVQVARGQEQVLVDVVGDDQDRSRPIALSFCDSRLGLRRFDAEALDHRKTVLASSCDRIAATPARYILRLTFWLKFSSGELGKILPPPRHSGLDAMPARARPVPF